MGNRPQMQATPGLPGQLLQVDPLGFSASTVVTPQDAIQRAGPHVAIGTHRGFMQAIRCRTNVVPKKAGCRHVPTTPGCQDTFFLRRRCRQSKRAGEQAAGTRGQGHQAVASCEVRYRNHLKFSRAGSPGRLPENRFPVLPTGPAVGANPDLTREPSPRDRQQGQFVGLTALTS